MGAKEPSIRGTITIEISPDKMNAVAVYSGDPDGEELTPDSILKLAAKEEISEGVSRREILDHFDRINRKSLTKEKFTISEGIAPQEEKPETVAWEDIDIPEHLREVAEATLAEARAAHIRVERSRKIEKTVNKKTLLGTKKEKITENEKYYERVYIDPSVVKSGLAREGTKIGTLQNRAPGVSGLDVYGQIVPAKKAADPEFYPGSGVSKQRGELLATFTGLVRIGKNWVDIVPFAPHDWSVNLSKDQATALLQFNPGSKQVEPPNPAEVRAKAVELGYDEERLLSESEIATIIDTAITTMKPVENASLSKSSDASFDIFVSEDKLKAVLSVTKGTGRGKPLSLKEMGAAIKDSKLKGLNLAQIKQDVMEFYESPETQLTGYVLAEGTAPTEGPAQEYEFEVHPLSDEKLVQLKERAQLFPDAASGLRSLTELPIAEVTQMAPVIEDQRIVTLTPVEVGQSGTNVYGASTPGLPGPAPKFKLFENIEQKGNVIISSIEGMLDRADTEEGFLLRVRPYKDAVIKVTISEDKMSASLTLAPAIGLGKPASEDAVMAALKLAGVREGIIEGRVAGALRALAKGESIKELTVAEGTPAHDGGSDKLELLVGDTGEKRVVIGSDGAADYKNLNRIVTVKSGQEVATIIPAEKTPEDGKDVLGNTVAAARGESVPVELVANLTQRENADGSVVIVANCAGEFVRKGKRLEVRKTHTVQGDVGVQTGNIKFSGTVQVGGSVNSGYAIMAAGAIHVAESVDGALLSADDDILIQQGVRGQSKAVLRTKKRISAAFLEQATILAIGDITVKNHCMRCDVKCNGEIQLSGEKGSLLGGTTQSRKGVVATNIGNDRGIRTEISFGQDYLIGDQIEKEEREIAKIKKQTADLDFQMRQYEHDLDNEGLLKARREKLRLMKVMEKRSLRLFDLRERFEEHHESRIEVRGTLYPGVVFESHGRRHEVTSPHKAVRVEFEQQSGRIEIAKLQTKDG
ncbi:MAG: FapA family protein [Spirochaeta sp.]|nr:FapA family protein [Spirochaeta sp.]